MLHKEYKIAEGAYAVPRMGNKSVVLMVTAEDVGKKERHIDQEELQAIVPGMFGLISGKKDMSDVSFAHTLSREIDEEYRLNKPPEAFTNGLPSIQIVQSRADGEYQFDAHGHQVTFTPEDLSFLNNETKTLEVDDEQLENFLLYNSGILRPSVKVILWLTLQGKKL